MISAVELVGAMPSPVRAMVERLLARLYAASNRGPWRTGYSQFKRQYLAKIQQDEAMLELFRSAIPLPSGHGFRLDARTVEIP